MIYFEHFKISTICVSKNKKNYFITTLKRVKPTLKILINFFEWVFAQGCQI